MLPAWYRSLRQKNNKKKHHSKEWCFLCNRVYKPGSVLTVIYLAPQLLTGSSHLLGTAGQACCPTHGVAPDRVYIVKPISLWAGWALTPPFHPYFVDSRIQIARFTANGKAHTVCGISSPHGTRLRWASMGPHLRGEAVYLCCTCPGVTPGGRYPLSLPYEARTFLTSCLSAWTRGCPARSPEYCTLRNPYCQISCKIFCVGLYYN